MRTALLSKSQARQAVSTVKTLPAPIGGWNARDALAAMPPTDAVALDNWMPKASYVELRGGYISYVDRVAIDLDTEDGSGLTDESGNLLATEDTQAGMMGNVKTLIPYNRSSGTNQLFAITTSNVYDVSVGPAPIDLGLARRDGKHQWTMFGDGTFQWLIACNGVDKPLYYNGTTWTVVDNTTSPALTGFTGNHVEQFISVTMFKSRLFFIPINSMSFWYLPAAVAGGALLQFDLSSQAKRGGYLVAMGVWTRDAGDGQDDVAVFITSEGEAILYQGDNPSSAANWDKVGTFFVGRPLGRRCLQQYAGDLVILTENGAFPISAALQSAIVNYQYALSSKIEKSFTDSARGAGNVFGWETTIYPAQQAMIVNVPVAEDGQHYQYVMNTLTKSWCRFTNWNAECFAIFNKELYFGQGNAVFKAWTGESDNGANIDAYGKQAFSYFGSIGRLKQFELFEPVLSTSGAVTYGTDIDVDFEDKSFVTSITAGNSGNALIWGRGQWGEAVWGGGLGVTQQWTGTATWPGYCAAGKLKLSTNTFQVQWMASNFMFKTGAIY